MHVSNLIREMVCHDRSKRLIFPHRNLAETQKIPQVAFGGLPISGSALWPSTVTPNVLRCAWMWPWLLCNSRAFVCKMKILS